ncbi:MAG: hypothetical protein L0241_06820 [Planctomycetia bacterium]|nr:hypothetical protein [Planctomycetia bacterium]
MTRGRFLSAVAAVCSASLLALAGGSSAAPVPKGAGGETPDLKVFFDTVGKAVKNENWPTDAEEKLLRETAEKIFERTLKVAKQDERKLPVEFDKLKKVDVSKEFRGERLGVGKEFKGERLDGKYVIAGDVRIKNTKGSVIFASGKVEFIAAENCVIFAQDIRGIALSSCLVVAGDYIQLAGAEEESVLIAGRWIRSDNMGDGICHVIRPGKLPAPDEKPNGNKSHPAIRINNVATTIFLNAPDDVRLERPLKCEFFPLKMPIAK